MQIRITYGPTWLHFDGEAAALRSAYKRLDRPLSYTPPGIEWAPSVQAGHWDGRMSLIKKIRGSESFCAPRGCFDTVWRILTKSDFEVEIVEALPEPIVVAEPDSIRWGGPEPWAYQNEAVQAILERGGGLLKLPMRAGKTLTAAKLVHTLGWRTLFVTTSQLLQAQSAAAFRAFLPSLDVSEYGDGSHDVTGDVVVASIQALCAMEKKRLASLCKSFSLIVYDECFVAGTLVDGRPIESLRKGDVVSSWDDTAHVYRQCRVTATFKSRPVKLVVAKFASGRKIVCTPNHPFLTKKGWIAAEFLDGCDVMVHAISHEPANNFTRDHVQPLREGLLVVAGSGFQNEGARTGSWRILLERMLSTGIQRRSISLRRSRAAQVSHMQCRIHTDSAHSQLGEIHKNRANLLLESVLDGVSQSGKLRNDESHEQKVRFRAYEDEKSDVEPRLEGKSSYVTPSARLAKPHDRGQRRWANSTATIACLRTWVEHGGLCVVREGGSQTRTSNLLQIGRSQYDVDDRRRSGRTVTRNTRSARARQEERRFLKFDRVESVEIHERGNSEQFDRLCPDGFVYNLEVERTHTYSANGVVVHNCHHFGCGSGDAWIDTAMQLDARMRVGLSATPPEITFGGKGEGWAYRLQGLLGGIVYEVGISDLIERGYLTRPTIRFVRYKTATLPSDLGGSSLYKQGIVECAARNEALVAVSVSRAQQGDRVLLDVSRVGHARALADIAKRYLHSKQIAVVTGPTPDDVRRKVFASWEEGSIKLVIGTVLGEGIDFPWLSTVVNGEAGKGDVATMQRFRNLTIFDSKKEALVFDTVDEHHRQLRQWTLARFRLYRKERAFNITIDKELA